MKSEEDVGCVDADASVRWGMEPSVGGRWEMREDGRKEWAGGAKKASETSGREDREAAAEGAKLPESWGKSAGKEGLCAGGSDDGAGACQGETEG
jgi:hypothetical protein